ncbi:MAG: glycosyltransferase [Solirubrobacteraceae bacterium MAG38_C4-C5]|nr:glycosyltransferase [Candidatus Siliceabacter maunaloa]
MVALPEEGPLAGELRAGGILVLVRPLAVLRRALATPRGLAGVARAAGADARALGRFAREQGVALVHSNTSVTLGGAAAARAAGVSHVWHVRESYEDLARLWPAYRRVLMTAAALPCVSAAVAAQFAGAGGRARTRLLHDGLAMEPCRAPRAAARAALGLPADAFVVAVAGRLSAWKGQDVLVRALAHAPLSEVPARGSPPGGRRAYPPTVALLAGDAWARDPRPAADLRALAARLGVADRVALPGFREDVETVYGAADVVAVPSTRPDPLPNAALEAAAAGCCVVACDHGGLPEILRDGATGVLIAPDDPAALARALAALRDAPARREALGTAAARDVRARFAPDRLGEAVQALYDEVLRGPG